jgi:hypothetical protein
MRPLSSKVPGLPVPAGPLADSPHSGSQTTTPPTTEWFSAPLGHHRNGYLELARGQEHSNRARNSAPQRHRTCHPQTRAGLERIGSIRINAKLPPGYADKKKGDRIIGDFFVWEQTLREAERRKKPVLMIITI